MASLRFLDRKAHVLEARVEARQAGERPGLQRALAMAGGMILALAAFFTLKGAALATGVALPGGEGFALWLAGPDPVTSALGAALEPVFQGRS